jgi:hypothetical protein
MLTPEQRQQYSDEIAAHGVAYCANRDMDDLHMLFAVIPWHAELVGEYKALLAVSV